MKIVIQDISLQLVSQDSLEELRQIRNTASMLGFMIDCNPISKEDQQKWYQNLDQKSNFFFLIQIGNRNIGVGHITSIDFGQKTAESGLYLIDERYGRTQVSVLSSLILLFLVFEILRLDLLKAKVLTNNIAAKEYNSTLGFQVGSNIDSNAIWMFLSNLTYNNRSKILLRKLLKHGGIKVFGKSTIQQEEYSLLWKATELFQLNPDSSQIQFEVH